MHPVGLDPGTLQLMPFLSHSSGIMTTDLFFRLLLDEVVLKKTKVLGI